MINHVTPATQLQIAEQWLREAVTYLLTTKGNQSLRLNLARVADDCAAVAAREDAR
jgi:hypothetical protein